MPKWLFLLKVALQIRRYRATECGHMTKRSGVWQAFGEERLMGLPIQQDGTTKYCHKCIEKMTIRCAWCGHPIFVVDGITLSICTDSDWVQPDYAVEYTKGGTTALVGCMRWECADSGMSFAGFWDTPGEVQRMPSPIEAVLQAAAAGSEEPIVFNDLSNPNQVLADFEANKKRAQKH